MNCVGIFDILSFDASQANPLAMMPHYQVLKEIKKLLSLFVRKENTIILHSLQFETFFFLTYM